MENESTQKSGCLCADADNGRGRYRRKRNMFLFKQKAGLIAAAAFVIVISAQLVNAALRHRHFRKLADEIDGILHGAEDICLSKYREGEISILENELTKLIVRLREQADALRSDKTKLADSIADISHQIKTPLTALNLIAESLGRSGMNAKNAWSFFLNSAGS